MQFLRQNTAVIVTVGPFYDKADGVTIEGSLTITNERITMTADTDAGSAPANILDNVTGATSGTDNDLNYITGNDAGMMQLELSAANTNRVGRMLLSITDAANHVPVFHEYFVLPQAIFDWLTGVIVPLPANVTTWLGTAAATPTVAGVPEVDVTHLGGAAQSATDLKDFADEGYDPSTNKVQGVVLTDTLTTYTGNTPQTGDSFARLGAPAGASVSADIAAIEAQTDDIGVAGAGLTDLGGMSTTMKAQVEAEVDDALGSGTGTALTAIPWNANWDAEVESEATDALNAYDPPTRTEATADKNEIIGYLSGLVIAKGTIGATGNSTTVLHLTGLTYGDDEINNYLIAIRDVSAGEWHARYITDWADTGDLATVATLPFTPEDSVDTYAVLAFRQDVTGGSGLDAAGVRAAVGLASANLDTQLDALPTAAENRAEMDSNSTKLASILEDTGTTLDDLVDDIESRLTAVRAGYLDNLSAGAVALEATAQSILADTGTDGVVVASGSKTGYRLSATGVDDVLDEVVEGSYTMRQFLRLLASSLGGKLSGAATTTVTIRNASDSKDVVVATVDADGNRSAVTLDLT